MHLDNLGGDDFVESVIGGEPFAAPGVGLVEVHLPSPTESFSFRSFFGEPWLLFRSRYISAWAPPSTGHDTSYLRKPSRSADGSKRCLETCGGRHLQKAGCASLDECSAAASFSALRLFHVFCLVCFSSRANKWNCRKAGERAMRYNHPMLRGWRTLPECFSRDVCDLGA
jgi:hypothetical protein